MSRTLACAVALLLIVPGTAAAATASTTPRTEYYAKGGEYEVSDLSLTATAGEVNEISLSTDRKGWVVRDRAGVTAGPGCTATDDREVVRCAGAPGLAKVDLGDGDDRLAGAVGIDGVDAGPGDDRVSLVGARVPRGTIAGGPGADTLEAGGILDGGEGADVLVGSAVTYAGRSEPISADLDGLADDGAAGEGDRIDPRVQDIVGGNQGDRLVGDEQANRLVGGPGADELAGGHGNDRLEGGGDDDRLDGGGGDDSVSAGLLGAEDRPAAAGGTERVLGGPGDDTLTGTAGADEIDGGAGADLIEGYGGSDAILAVDGAPDRVGCGVPPDRSGRASLDGLDLARGCAAVDRTAPGAPRLLVLGQMDLDRDGLVRVGVACSQDQRGGCPIRVRLVGGGRTLATRRTTVPPGTAKLVRPEVPERVARRVRSCRRLSLKVVVTGRATDGSVHRIQRSLPFSSTSLRCGGYFLLAIGPDAGW